MAESVADSTIVIDAPLEFEDFRGAIDNEDLEQVTNPVSAPQPHARENRGTCSQGIARDSFSRGNRLQGDRIPGHDAG